MTKKIEKLLRNYWSISKFVAVLFTICNYRMWTEPFNFIKAIVMIVLSSVATFFAINVLDIIVGLITRLHKKINRYIYDKRLLKGFCGQKENEV